MFKLSAAIVAVAVGLWTAGHAADPAETKPGQALILEIDGAIGPATTEYVSQGLETARLARSEIVILRIDTPGGLDSAMREIIKNILGSPVPVATYVTPSGARAASAGTYILYGSHAAAMAPGTTLGAATPVKMGGMSPEPPDESGPDGKDGKDGKGKEAADDSPATMKDKVVNDAVAYIRGLAELRGRNADWAEKAVREAATLTSSEAVERNVVDLMASDERDLLNKLDGRTVEVLDAEKTLSTAGITTREIEPDWRSKLLGVITNPNVAYILMLVGIYGLIFEFSSPGAIVPGVVGAISLLLALYAFHALPVNLAGAGLLVLGIGLMVAEAFAPSFGALGLGGVAAFVIGSLLLMDTDVPGFEISMWLIGSVALLASGLFLGTMVLFMRSRKRAVVSGPEDMLGSSGQVVDWQGHEGHVRTHGEIWSARADRPLGAGMHIRILKIEGLTLVVEPEQKER